MTICPNDHVKPNDSIIRVITLSRFHIDSILNCLGGGGEKWLAGVDVIRDKEMGRERERDGEGE